MLAGNSNVVRVPTKRWPQVDAVCDVLRELLERDEYAGLRAGTTLIRYERDDEITGYFSSLCDARIIWGGDAAVEAIRKIPIPPRCVEITFADRYSCCALGAEAILELDEPGLEALSRAFYNDTYLVDQNACSSPNLVFWLGERVQEASERFWAALERSASRYDLEPILATDKYASLCDYVMGDYGVKSVVTHGNLIYRAQLDSLRMVESCRGRFGLFFEYRAKSLDELMRSVTPRWQTLTYFGLRGEELSAFVTERALRGIDRIVPVGSALDIGVFWDGYDLIRSLSRRVQFESRSQVK
jgi:hypothetical protein